MFKNILFWILAFIITCGSAVFQRMTGPTYPVRGEVTFENQTIKYKFDRSHEGADNHKVTLSITDKNIKGTLVYKRYKSNDTLSYVPMLRDGDNLYAEFPGQPAAGKVQYQVILSKGDNKVSIPDNAITLRFKGAVPAIWLIPHILIMFVAMLFSMKAGIEVLRKEPNLKWLITWTLVLLFLGGMILGPIVQYYAFGEFWTGIPFGVDLTDNKTLFALIAWIAAFISIKRGKSIKTWTLIASIVLFLVYMIPHSVLGSEIDYSKEEKTQIIQHK
jgi:hypothetical protein